MTGGGYILLIMHGMIELGEMPPDSPLPPERQQHRHLCELCEWYYVVSGRLELCEWYYVVSGRLELCEWYYVVSGRLN